MPHIGDEFDGFRIDGVLGRGGMGTVYRATDLTLKRPVAIKVLSRQLSSDAQFVERFRREAEIQANLEHRHIVAVHAFGEIGDDLYLVMRMIRGDALSTLLDRGRLSRSEALDVLAQVADALDSAHQVNLVHRDVKPDNILVSEDGNAYLADFGLTRDISDNVRLTRSGAFVGTVNYVSPEQVRGLSPTASADIYSLTAALFECMTGQLPYLRDSEVAVMHAHMEDPVPSACALNPALPSAFDDVISAGLAKDPVDRPTSAMQLIQMARSALSGAASTNGSPGWDATAITGDRPSPPHDRVATSRTAGVRPMRAARTIGAGVLVLAGVAWLMFSLLPGHKPDAPATKGGRLTIATLDRVNFGQYLDRISGSRSDYQRAELERAGVLVGMDLRVTGYRGKSLPVRWRVIDARTGDLVQQSAALSYRPDAEEDQNSWPVWIPLPRGRDRRFFAEIELLDDRGATPLARARTHRFEGT